MVQGEEASDGLGGEYTSRFKEGGEIRSTEQEEQEEDGDDDDDDNDEEAFR